MAHDLHMNSTFIKASQNYTYINTYMHVYIYRDQQKTSLVFDDNQFGDKVKNIKHALFLFHSKHLTPPWASVEIPPKQSQSFLMHIL